jgi:hypothetical protein
MPIQLSGLKSDISDDVPGRNVVPLAVDIDDESGEDQRFRFYIRHVLHARQGHEVTTNRRRDTSS